MQVGMCKMKLHLPESQSLKDKRRILKSTITRVRNNYNVSIAEVADQDLWQLATLGISCTTNSNPQAHEILSKVVSFVQCGKFDFEVVDVETEIISF